MGWIITIILHKVIRKKKKENIFCLESTNYSFAKLRNIKNIEIEI